MKNVLNQFIYWLPMIIILSTQELFFPFPYEYPDYSHHTGYLAKMDTFSKLIPFFALGIIVYKISNIGKHALVYFLIVACYFIFLIFESLYQYNSFFEYPHVFLKIINLFVVIAIYVIYKKNSTRNFDLLPSLILLAIIIRFFLDPQILSINAFLEHDRRLPATSVLLLTLPLIYFFNIYLKQFNRLALFYFLGLFFLIIYFQHRTVWISVLIALLINTILLIKNKSVDPARGFFYSVPFIILIVFAAILVLTYFPNISEKMADSIDQISNPAREESTSEWRIEQIKSYLPYVQNHLTFGMRLKGFDLPVQFYQEGTDVSLFPDKTGHHFHNFYFDILFYFGIAGLIVFLLFIINPILKVFSGNIKLDYISISFVSFVFGGFVYGLSYELPFFFWPFLGYTWAMTESSSYIKETNLRSSIKSLG